MSKKKPIQEQFGEAVIKIFSDFARADLKTADELEKDEFSHDRFSSEALRALLTAVQYLSRGASVRVDAGSSVGGLRLTPTAPPAACSPASALRHIGVLVDCELVDDSGSLLVTPRS